MPAIMTETMSGATTEPILDPTIPAIANQPVLPTVTYDGVTMTITAYVIVSFSNTDPSGLSIQAPLIAIPAATPASTSPWTVLWIAQADATLAWASFGTNGVDIDSIFVRSTTPGLPQDQQQKQIKNAVPVAFNYRITVTGAQTDGTVTGARTIGTVTGARTLFNLPLTTTQDPTIVVTMDPVGS
jgi:hypothetical protein